MPNAAHTTGVPVSSIENVKSLFYGQLGVDLLTGKLLTKTVNSKYLYVGGGINYFREAEDYDTSLSERNYYSLMGLTSEGTLVDTVPSILLSDLGGTNLVEDAAYRQLNPYLGMDAAGDIVNSPKPAFKLHELYQVAITPNASNNNYVLTHYSSYNTLTDVKVNYTNYSRYILSPSITKLTLLDDFLAQTIAPYQVVRRRNPVNLPAGYNAINENLAISGDTKPLLANSLDAKGYAITNLSMATLVLHPSKPFEVISWNVDKYSCILIDGRLGVTKDLAVNIASETLVLSDKVGYLSVQVINYTGSLSFANCRVYYENGKPPSVGGDFWLGGILRNISGTYNLTLIQRAYNLQSNVLP